ncbi:YlbF family regulator [Phosphitispora sp. TUW77]|uniref:YlbF family regulator n=1 Tax=Phosphitispora sp. TUW77 TaxID=3152361 RepID=UPI003AB3ED48
MNVYDQANVLAKAILESEQYKMLKKNKNRIEADERTKKMFADYRQQQFELQKMHMAGLTVPEEKIKQLKKMYEIMIPNQVIKDFMEAELRFNTMMADVQRILINVLKLGEK